jgi:hypothetical protein
MEITMDMVNNPLMSSMDIPSLVCLVEVIAVTPNQPHMVPIHTGRALRASGKLRLYSHLVLSLPLPPVVAVLLIDLGAANSGRKRCHIGAAPVSVFQLVILST